MREQKTKDGYSEINSAVCGIRNSGLLDNVMTEVKGLWTIIDRE